MSSIRLTMEMKDTLLEKMINHLFDFDSLEKKFNVYNDKIKEVILNSENLKLAKKIVSEYPSIVPDNPYITFVVPTTSARSDSTAMRCTLYILKMMKQLELKVPQAYFGKTYYRFVYTHAYSYCHSDSDNCLEAVAYDHAKSFFTESEIETLMNYITERDNEVFKILQNIYKAETKIKNILDSVNTSNQLFKVLPNAIKFFNNPAVKESTNTPKVYEVNEEVNSWFN